MRGHPRIPRIFATLEVPEISSYLNLHLNYRDGAGGIREGYPGIAMIGGGFKYFFIFIPTWGNIPIWRAYFSDRLKPPTSRYFSHFHLKHWETWALSLIWLFSLVGLKPHTLQKVSTWIFPFFGSGISMYEPSFATIIWHLISKNHGKLPGPPPIVGPPIPILLPYHHIPLPFQNLLKYGNGMGSRRGKGVPHAWGSLEKPGIGYPVLGGSSQL